MYSRPVLKKDPDEPPNGDFSSLMIGYHSLEFRDLWVETHFFRAAHTFPTIHRRSEVTTQERVLVCPLDNAIGYVGGSYFEQLENFPLFFFSSISP